MKIKETEVKYQEKGITLVALVVTIIILLILAGITINLTLGEHAILDMAKQAGQNWQNAQKSEDMALMEYENEIRKYVSGSTSQSNISYDNYISLRGGTGIASEKKALDQGVYEVNYFGSTFTRVGSVLPAEVFINDECKLSEKGSAIYDTEVKGFGYGCAGFTSTITLEEKSEVYLRFGVGPSHSFGMITMIKIKDI